MTRPGKRRQTRKELLAQYKEHWGFLRSSCDAYDAGNTSEAKRLAVSLRVLLHTTRSSHSLLGQLGLDDILFFDTAEDVNPANLAATFGLLMIQLDQHGAKYAIPPAHMPLPHPTWLIPFREWWKKAVIVVPSENLSLSRRDLVLTMANQDGGAHVDPDVEEAYYRVSREYVASATVSTPSGEQPLPDIERASVRQIAQEVLLTLVSGYRTIPDNLPEMGEEKRYSTVHDARTGETKRIEHKVRNVCPYRSGKDYFDCHGRRKPTTR